MAISQTSPAFKFICQIMEEIYGINDFDEDTQLKDDLGFDSLYLVDLAMETEVEFGISFEEDEFFEAVTVGDFVRIIEEKMLSKKERHAQG